MSHIHLNLLNMMFRYQCLLHYIPNAKLTDSTKKCKNYVAANGGLLGNQGQTTVHARTQEGTARTITWQNIKLKLPIPIST